ncbi:adenylate/guanylate cyclase domain-containing protein [Blastococcus sp. SYSU D00669]
MFAAAGAVVWWLRPDSRTGPWMLAFAVLQLLRQVQIPADSSAAGLVALLRIPVIFIGPVLLTPLLLGFPSGRLSGRREQLLFRGGLVLAVLGTVVVALTQTPVPWLCGNGCPRSPVSLVDSIPLYLGVHATLRLTFTGLAMTVLVLLIRQARRWTRRQRRSRSFMLVAGCLAIVGYVANQVMVVAAYPRWIGMEVIWPVEHAALWSVVLALPVAVVFGIVRERLAFSSVGELLVLLERTPAERIEPALAHALRDPGLRLAFPTPQGLVDSDGARVEPPPEGGQTPLGDPPVAVVLHDPSVAEHRPLLAAVASAARLALENARLQADVAARRGEAEESAAELLRARDESRTLARLVPGGLAERLRADPDALTQPERLIVTVLMSDVRGYSAIAETTPPDVLARQLDAHRKAMNGIVLAEGGTVLQYVGDAVMAVFGAPLPLAAHEEHALRAAAGMHRAQRRLDAEWAARGLPPFGLGIGVCTGEVAAGLLGSAERVEYTVVGDTVNLAARLVDLARPAGVTVAAASTVAAAGGGWPVEALPPTGVKGRMAPVAAYRVLEPVGSATSG